MAAISYSNSRAEQNKDEFYSCRADKIAAAISSVPAISMLLCIFVSFLLHWDESTETHCKVPNYLPSISSAIGGFTPQRYIWRIGIALHAAPRFLVAFVYFHFYQQVAKKLWIQRAAFLAFLFNIVEVFSLLGLSYVSSTENFDFHEAAFISFIACSMLYMVITCLLLHAISKVESSEKLKNSLVLKLKIMGFYMFIFALAVYFYLRHNTYCESGVYTLFALCEYLVVLANIAFHATIIYDFGGSILSIGPLFNSIERSTVKYR